MKKLRLIVGGLIAISLLTLNPIKANAEWKENSNGWWYTEGSSWATGWKLIDNKWYYFYSDGYAAHDTAIDGYYLNSNGAWTGSTTTSVRQEILKNVSVQNPTFYIEFSASDVHINNIGNVIKSEINKLKISNPYEMYNVSEYQFAISSDDADTIRIKVNCTYKMTSKMASDLDSRAKEIVEDIAPDSMSQSEKELAIHDWIVNNTKYDLTYEIYDPYNTLIKHTGVCEGYALLAQKMFTIAGIKSTFIEGTVDGQPHAWNMVYIDNKWRHVDCTWDDPVDQVYNEDILSHDYYNLTDKEISADHKWDTSVYPKAN